MRIVYDDTQQNLVIDLLESFMDTLDLRAVVEYDYGMDRVQRYRVKELLNRHFNDSYCEIGNSVTHAHGIGNNCCYPVYYHDTDEIQHCANININQGLYGEVYVSLENYNKERIGQKYELHKYGIIRGA